MSALFADTFYFLALLNAEDEHHGAADRFESTSDQRLVTTAWVLTELADGIAETAGRTLFETFLAELEDDPNTEIVLPEPELWRRGVKLYASRPDKEWTLTDCISFVVMTERGITGALTGDHHFEQAGFRALLKTT
jgi:hypothetical protein